MWVGVGVGVNTLPFLIVHVELKALQYQSIFLEVLVDQLSLPSSSILIVRSNAMSYQLLCAKAGLSTSYMYTRSRANTSCFVCSHATIHTRVTHTRTIYTHAIYLFINTLTCKHKLLRMSTCSYPYTCHPYTYYSCTYYPYTCYTNTYYLYTCLHANTSCRECSHSIHVFTQAVMHAHTLCIFSHKLLCMPTHSSYLCRNQAPRRQHRK